MIVSAVRTIRRCRLAFHGAFAGMALLNMLVLIGARQVVPDQAASAAGIAVAAVGNFPFGDHLVFRHRAVLGTARSNPEEPAA